MKQVLRSSFIAATLRYRGFEPEDALLLSCDPRSGSTWLSEVLCAARPSAVIWEPFHLDNAPKVRELGFAWRQIIPPDAEWPEAEALIREILSGLHINRWTGWASRVAEFQRAERLIVKCCRANGFLPWLLRRIEFRRRPVHFLRHPFAIAASQLRMGNFGTSGMSDDLERGPYAADLADSAAYIRALTSDEERIVAMWCRVQKPALDDPVTARRAVRMHYETLTLNPEAELVRLFAAWGEPLPTSALDAIETASRMTEDASKLGDAEAQIGKWQQQFSDRQINRMADVLRQFEVDVYDDSPMPVDRRPMPQLQ
ncbi:sulfotransferase [Marivita sp. GX14005]|uniref:sulfotransferase n=1 Tax=Marivita sp. GX14005 TaxID=2942276 RepID=UPI0020195F3D|nr:sulfotransferase [Marivita sp. GX14005]MCL3881749.1 sulfotransferase [Marivita sp. GX14005]